MPLSKPQKAPDGCHNQRVRAELQDQTITFGAVGAHHQNGAAERNIQTIVPWALSMMLHQLLHWPDAFDEALWPLALEHAVHLWNHLPVLGPLFLQNG